MCKKVFITDERYSKLIKMYNLDYFNHRDYHVSGNLDVILKSTQNLVTANFCSKTHYIYI